MTHTQEEHSGYFALGRRYRTMTHTQEEHSSQDTTAGVRALKLLSALAGQLPIELAIACRP